MSRKSLSILSHAALLLFAAGSLHAQSLGDIARQQQQQKQQQTAKSGSAASKKVITNEDMPASQTPSSANSTSAWKIDAPEPTSAPDNEKTAEQWKQTIQVQKSFVAQLQQAIDKRKASIHYVEANLYSNGAQHNELQARKQADVERLEQRLAAEKKKLEDMQEACRQAGFGNAVYE
jgi:hypothetical protein